MIELRDVTKEYSKGNAALNGVSVKIEQGEFANDLTRAEHGDEVFTAIVRRVAELHFALGEDVQAITLIPFAEECISALQACFAHQLAETLQIFRIEILEEGNPLKNGGVHLFPFFRKPRWPQ